MRTLDASFLNEIANDPIVRPFLGKSGSLDLTLIVSDPNNHCFVCEQGGFVGIRLQPGIYEIHTIFHPGDALCALEFARSCMAIMFTQTDCVELKSKIPTSNGGARVLATKSGLSRTFSRNACWEDGDGNRQDVDYFSIDIDTWVTFDKGNSETGNLVFHCPDKIGSAFLGAAARMIRANNGAKGVALYNRWATFVEEQPITILGINPFLFEAFDETFDANCEVMKCR